MLKLRNYLSSLMVLILLSCSSAPTLVEVPYPVFIPGVHDTIQLVQDTIYVPSDSNAYWEGNVEDSLKNVIGWMKVYYNRKIAELKLNPRIDTVKVKEKVVEYKDRPVQVLVGLLPWWGETLVILFTAGLLAFASKKTNILELVKGIFK